VHWRENLGHCWDFTAPPQWFAALGIVSPSLRTWCDTSRQSAQLWNSKSPEYRTASTWENTTTAVRPCIQNAHERLVRQALLAKPICRQGPRWNNCISDLAWSRLGVESAKLQVLLWMLPPQHSLEEKRAWKWMKWITFTLVYSPVFKSAQLVSEHVL